MILSSPGRHCPERRHGEWLIVLQKVQQKTLRKLPVLLLLLFQVLFPMSVVLGVEPEPYPEILTLEYALAQASDQHPQLQVAASKIDKNRALSDEVDAQIGLQSRLSARLRWIDPPSIAPDQSRDDHWLSLSVDKPLYDFGRHAAQLAASKAATLSAEQEYRVAKNQHRIAILAAYFDVLLADQAYARDNEDMSMGYVHMDRARQRNELGQLSDIELTAARSEYQASRVRRYRSSVAQRTTRSRLANVLDRPGQLPDELQAPKLDILQRPIPEDINEWVEEAEQNNVRLSADRLRVEQVKAQLNAARAIDNPRLTGSAEISRYSRELGSSDLWRAGVLLEVPLTTGGRSDAERAKYRAEMTMARAELEQHRRDVSQAILETWGELQALKVAQQSAQAEAEFRDLYLDRSRALYELEVTSDLGDAMVKTTAVRYQTMKTNFMMALAWARLDALLGRKVFAEPPDTSAVQMEKDS